MAIRSCCNATSGSRSSRPSIAPRHPSPGRVPGWGTAGRGVSQPGNQFRLQEVGVLHRHEHRPEPLLPQPWPECQLLPPLPLLEPRAELRPEPPPVAPQRPPAPQEVLLVEERPLQARELGRDVRHKEPKERVLLP